MKTLDEVIKGMEHCHEDNCMECPYQFEPKDFDCITQCQYTDALHYLKEYQKDKMIYSYDIARRNLELAERNDPLTWEQFKQMEGKPVWIEGKTVKHWAVITGIYYDDLNEGYLLETYYAEKQGSNTSRRKRSTLGKTWQAYRKERK